MKINKDKIWVNNPSVKPPGVVETTSEMTRAFRDRLEAFLSVMNSPFAENQISGTVRVSNSELVSLGRVSVFLIESLKAMKRLWNMLPDEFKTYVNFPGTPPDGDKLLSDHAPIWKEGHVLLQYSEKGIEAPMICQPGVVQALTTEAANWMMMLVTYRSLLPYVTPSLDYLNSLAALDPLLALPNFEAIAICAGREMGDYDLNIIDLLTGRDELIIYFDTLSKNPSVLSSGPIASQLSAPLFDTRDPKTKKRDNWGQIRSMMRKNDDLLKTYMCGPKAGMSAMDEHVFDATRKEEIYWDPKDAKTVLSKVPLENLYWITAPTVLQEWFSYCVKMGQSNVTRIPTRTAHTSDIKIGDLEAISTAFSKTNKFTFDARFRNGSAQHHNFANPMIPCQNPPLVTSVDTMTLSKGRITIEPKPIDYRQIWENSFERAFAHSADLTTTPPDQGTVKGANIKQAIDVANARALLGFGLGTYSALFSLLVCYNCRNYDDVITTVYRRAADDPLAKLLYMYLIALSSKGKRWLELTYHVLINNPSYLAIHVQRATGGISDRTQTHYNIEYSQVSADRGDLVLSGLNPLSNRSQFERFIPDRLDLKLDASHLTPEKKRKTFSLLRKLQN